MLKVYTILLLIYYKRSTSEFNWIPLKFPQTQFDHIIEITLYNDSFETNIFKGQNSIIFFKSVESNNVYINSNNSTINITNVEIISAQGNEETNTLAQIIYIEEDIVQLIFRKPIPAGYYILKIDFIGSINNNTMKGFYKSLYKDRSGNIHYLGVTNFKATYTSMAFPCMDLYFSPARYTFTLIYPPKYKIWSNNVEDISENLPDSLVKTTFKATPEMPSYLAAFVVAEFTCNSTSDRNYIRVCSSPETEEQREYALEIIPKVLSFMEKYTGVLYQSLGIEKLDIIAIPDFPLSDDAKNNVMGNWGLSICGEYHLLWDKNKSSILNKQQIASAIAYQIAGMWFQCFHSPTSWRDVFIGVGASKFFEYFVLEKLEKDWHVEHQFIVDQMHRSLWEEQEKPTLQLAFGNPTSYEHINQKFDLYQYIKGACILRMLFYLKEEKNFQNAIKCLFDKNFMPRKTDKFVHLVHCINKSDGSLMRKIYSTPQEMNPMRFALSWLEGPSFPFLEVNLETNDVTLQQEAFAQDSFFFWNIPITYASSHKENFSNTTVDIVLRPFHKPLRFNNVIKNKSDWIIFNNQQIGYYRVDYGLSLWARIQHVLKSNPEIIDPISKAQIIDDLFCFAYENFYDYDKVMSYITFLRKEEAYITWRVALRNFDKILQAIHNESIRKKLMNFIKELMEHLFLKFRRTKADHLYTLMQVQVLEWACRLEKDYCLKLAKTHFAMVKKGLLVNSDIVPIIYCTVLRRADDQNSAFNFLWNLYETSFVPTEKQTIMEALTCTTNDKLVEKYLNYTMNSIGTSRQNNIIYILKLFGRRHNNLPTILEYMLKNLEKLVNSCNHDSDCLLDFTEVFSVFLTKKSEISQVKKLMKTHTLSQDIKHVLNESISKANILLKKSEELEKEIAVYFRNSATSIIMFGKKIVIICILYELKKLKNIIQN